MGHRRESARLVLVASVVERYDSVTAMRLHLINYVLWLMAPAVMLAIAARMLRSGLRREFPCFFNFVVFGIVTFAVEFLLRNSANYYYVYWVITALGVLFSFAVLVELVQKVVDGTKTLEHWNIPLFCWCALAAMAMVGMWPLASSMDNVTNGIFVVNRTVRVAQFALAFFMVMFGAALGISKRNLLFGIAIGFGFFSVVHLLVMVSVEHQTRLSNTTLSRVSSAAYVISLFIWLAYAVMATKDADLRQLS